MAFVGEEDRYILKDFVHIDNPVRVIDSYVVSLDLGELDFMIYSGSLLGVTFYKKV